MSAPSIHLPRVQPANARAEVFDDPVQRMGDLDARLQYIGRTLR